MVSPNKPTCLLCDCHDVREVNGPTDLKSVTSDCKPWNSFVEIGICSRCNHVQKFVDSNWQRHIEAIYADYDLYHLSDGIEQIIFDQPNPRRRSEILLDYIDETLDLPSGGQLLDIGCGEGATLRAFSARHTSWDLFGFEKNDRYLESVMGISNVSGFFSESLKKIDEQFDLIVLVHVLEHVPLPGAMLDQIRRLLKPGAPLLIQVPNLLENPFDLMVIDHCSHFTLTILRSFVENRAFEVAHTDTNRVPKEITIVLRDLDGKPAESTIRSDMPNLRVVVESYLEWLEAIVQQARKAGDTRNFGIFGTAIAGTWLAQALGPVASFFVDEDVSRIGKRHMGRPVVFPKEVPQDTWVYIALVPQSAKKVSCRLESSTKACYMTPLGLFEFEGR